MLNEKLQQAINKQINAELHSSYLYYSMCAYLQNNGLSGFAHWTKIQAQEELTHANKFFDYVNERGGRVTLTAIEAVPTEFDGVLAVFKQIKQHEELVSELINNLMDVALSVNDHATKSFLQWFIDEQVEEEANVQAILDNLKLINGEGHGMLLLDRELMTRVFVDATQTGA
ncbi:MAG: ferritin [Bacteroidota bacterium]|nr:ferritin [Bacteroidota bacterium]MDP4204622.1 ferritin [Bacteroidota bacterium]